MVLGNRFSFYIYTISVNIILFTLPIAKNSCTVLLNLCICNQVANKNMLNCQLPNVFFEFSVSIFSKAIH